MIITELDKWIIGLTVAGTLALSGWGKVLIDHVTSKPKIAGRLVSCIRGRFSINGREFSSFLVYPYLYNLRKNSMNIYNYELFIEVKGAWVALDSLYALENSPTVDFFNENGELLKIKNFKDQILYRKEPELKFGVAVHGWLPFCGDPSLYSENVTRYKLVCIDATLKRHEIITDKSSMDQPLLFRLANVESSLMVVFAKKK